MIFRSIAFTIQSIFRKSLFYNLNIIIYPRLKIFLNDIYFHIILPSTNSDLSFS